ncbi:MAG: amidohydrolase family protein [Gemmatimonadota bacterium]
MPPEPNTGRVSHRAVLLITLVASAGPLAAQRVRPEAAPFDLILRHGSIIDGTGARRYQADLGISNGRIAAIGDLARARAAVDIDVKGLFVAPGFINIHSHASPAALPNADNMLTQGVTTEILNPDGGGPIDIAPQLAQLVAGGLAVNVGAYIGFNSVWASVVGPSDRRPSPEEIARMQALITDNLARGAWGVSSGLDYKPAYFATADEAAAVLKPAAPWRTNYTNHDRLSPENHYSSKAGMLETAQIGEASGLVPVFTHMKLQGHEQGTSAAMLDWMRRQTAKGHYVTADVYPYLAGQTSLVAFFVPGWAQDGGRDKMLERFRDPAQRTRIVAEAEDALKARFGGPEGVFFPTTGRELVDIMRETQVTSPGEAIVRILEKETPTVILRFGAEDDLRRLLQYRDIAIACDCGATPNGRRGHPRTYGTFPRVLGHYVRETGTLTWEEAVRKMTGVPASTVGLVDRGFLALGMAADVAVFDPKVVIDHATYEDPEKLSEGIRFVLVNGRVALRDGAPTGERGGQGLTRSGHMPTRPMSAAVRRSLTAGGSVVMSAADASALGWSGAGDTVFAVRISVSQRPGERPKGTIRFADRTSRTVLSGGELGMLQTGPAWASFTGRGRDRHSLSVTVERADPFVAGAPATVTIELEGRPRVTGVLTGGQVTVSPARP